MGKISKKQIEQQFDTLITQLEHNQITAKELRAELILLLEQLDFVELDFLGSRNDIVASFNRVFEAFLTSDYADDKNERTTAVILMHQLKTVL